MIATKDRWGGGPAASAGRCQAVVVVFLVLLLAVVAAPRRASADTVEDPYRSQQWYLDHTGVPDAWEASRGEGVTIAVLDSGVDLSHPDLVSQFLRDADGNVVGYDFADDDPDPQDLNGHGTMVAGIAAAAANGRGVVGVAPEATILPVRVLDRDGSGIADDVDVGIRWAVDQGAQVINLSLEAEDPDGVLSVPVKAIRYAWERGAIVVAAVGNSGLPFTDYPEDAPLLLVGATDRLDAPADFSDSGRADLVMAPGVEIVSAWCDPLETGQCDPTFRYGESDGTSFAAPQVAGVAALLRGAGFGPVEAVRRIRSSAVDLDPPGRDDSSGFGRLDAAAAVAGAVREPAAAGPDISPEPAGSPGPAPTPATSAPPDDGAAPATASPQHATSDRESDGSERPGAALRRSDEGPDADAPEAAPAAGTPTTGHGADASTDEAMAGADRRASEESSSVESVWSGPARWASLGIVLAGMLLLAYRLQR